MRLKSPSDNIPNFDNLFNITCDYVREHQGEKGYINTDPEQDELSLDTIYGIKYTEFSGVGEEQIVFGVRFKDNDLEVLMRPWMRTYHNAPTEEEIADDTNWESVRWSDVYYLPTLLAVAEGIESYCEDAN